MKKIYKLYPLFIVFVAESPDDPPIKLRKAIRLSKENSNGN